eukprot:364409-Chlamydomonas_euryale.AAC.6
MRSHMSSCACFNTQQACAHSQSRCRHVCHVGADPALLPWAAARHSDDAISEGGQGHNGHDGRNGHN